MSNRHLPFRPGASMLWKMNETSVEHREFEGTEKPCEDNGDSRVPFLEDILAAQDLRKDYAAVSQTPATDR